MTARTGIGKPQRVQRKGFSLFLNRPIGVTIDKRHSKVEQRFAALGHADSGRRLTPCFFDQYPP